MGSNDLNGKTPEGLKVLTDEPSGISRRKFLKILGSTSALGVAAGCTDSAHQNILPNVKGDDTQVPGVAVWFRSTCTECTAGCGIQVRTREGRAVKIEGSPDSPINRGGLCALGQSALQNLYDPDRVRQPLKKEGTGSTARFVPITWDEAYAKIARELKSGEGKRALLTGETTGALAELCTDWAGAFKADHVTYDLIQPVAAAKAAELVYGTYGIPSFDFEKAEAIVNFGADFVETWVSPVEYARGWAAGRRTSRPAKFVHIEPRLSLTGANADLWLSAKAGTEVLLALALLKLALESGKGGNLSDTVRSGLEKLVASVSVESVAAATGISTEKILLTSHILAEAKQSLVLAGGASSATSDPLPLLVATNLLNLVLANVGRTIDITRMRTPKSSYSDLTTLVKSMNDGEVGALFIHGTNPGFTAPASLGFKYAVNKVRLVVSFSSQLDETARLADLILPAHHSLESWGDHRPMPGVYSLLQPVMQPVFDTRPFGDMLIGLARAGGKEKVSDGQQNFEGYLKASWQKVHASSNSGGDFDHFWREAVERGGYFAAANSEEHGRVRVSPSVFDLEFLPAELQGRDGHGEYRILPYPSVKSFDGRAANRPWMQELPDPITQIVWDSWAEIHPDTAQKFGFERGDMVTIRNHYGEVDVPVFVTPYVQAGLIAVPMGQGHTSFGRYAEKIQSANIIDLVPPGSKSGAAVPLMAITADIMRSPGRTKLVVTQGSDSQHGRELARTAFITAGAAEGAAHAEGHGAAHGVANGHGAAHGNGAHGGEHHEPKQMYVQREHPLYHWGLGVDLSVCTGCSACVVACSAENNIVSAGKKAASKGREMSWLRIERYYDGPAEELQVSFLPMMCQHCGNAPCEPVCPVYATYHNEEGLNVMVYNRCVGTRYCSNNCTYKVRRFNWFEYDLPEPLTWQLNPDVTKRGLGVMEKCTFCVQRIVEAKDRAKDEGRMVQDGEVKPACVQSCPTQALVFGNLNDPESAVSRLGRSQRAYKVLDHHLNTQPSVNYLERVKYHI